MFRLDALMRHLLEDEAARCFLGIAHRPANRGAATERSDTDRAIERVAAADFVECGGVLLGTAPGNTRRMKGKVTHRHADAEYPRRDFGRFLLKVHSGIRHAGSAFCRNQGPELIDWSMDGSRYALVSFPPCTQRPIRWCAIANGCAANKPSGCSRRCIRATSPRSNQRASSSSLRSTTISSLRARPPHPIISDDGYGHGCVM